MPQDTAFCAVSCGSVLSRAFQNETHHSAIAGKQAMTASGGNFIGCLLNRNKRAAQRAVAPIEVAGQCGKSRPPKVVEK